MSTTRIAPSWTELEALVGPDCVANATPAEAVVGVQPLKVVLPRTAEDLAQVLKFARENGLRVAPRGHGSKLEWGNAPAGLDLIVSTRNLNRVLEHAWADMTATVEAGCTVADLQRVLAEHGQRLALDALWPERATIGGILATNDSGSLRLRFGALRDLIIGVTIALPDGTLARSGGKVVKNVAGYDLPKLATGSLGTLGVITQAIFRLHPLPRESRTVSFAGPADALCKFMLGLQDSRLAHTGLQLRVNGAGGAEVDVRFAGVADAIEPQVSELKRIAGVLRPMDSSSGDVWKVRESLFEGNEPALVCKFSVLPTQIPLVLALASSYAPWKIVVQATGLGYLRLETAEEPSLPDICESLRKEIVALKGSLAALHCPPAVKRRVEAWGPTGDTLPLMRRIKEQFDPTGVLNPGRFIGGI